MNKFTKKLLIFSCQIFFFSAFLVCQSCSTQEEIKFNPDYSGTMSYNFDMSMMTQATKGLQEKMDSSNTEKKDETKEKDMIAETAPQVEIILAKIKKINGISNVKNDSEGKGKIAFSFAFKNIKALNEAYGHVHSSKNFVQSLMQKGGDGFQKGSPDENIFNDKMLVDAPYFEYFKQKGRKFYVNFPKNNEIKTETKNTDKQTQEMMAGMFKSETRIVLPKDIKSGADKMDDISAEGNTLTITQKMENTSKKAKNISLKLK
jgi:hypothetical protein